MAQIKNLWSILRGKYPENEYVLMEEVSNAAGFNRSNSADFIAVNLWPSRGLAINGIELKSFRSDWLRELKKPDKAESIFQYCDYFWLLTTDDTIAKLEEIPVTWGWMCVKGCKIKVLKDAPKLTPAQLSKGFLISMLRRAADKSSFVHKDSIQDKINEAKEIVAQQKDRDREIQLKRAVQLNKIVTEFEEHSGLRFGTWGGYEPKKIGSAVKFINENGTEGIKKDLEQLEITATNICNKIKQVLEAL